MTTKNQQTSYTPLLDLRQTEEAILRIKGFFQENLAEELNLLRVTAPLFVEAGTGINDDLNGVERPISFTVPSLGQKRVEIVQSLVLLLLRVAVTASLRAVASRWLAVSAPIAPAVWTVPCVASWRRRRI